MSTHYVSDYEELTGQKPAVGGELVEAKVVTAPKKPKPKTTVAEVK